MTGGLDIRTLMVVAGSLYVLLPVSTWLILRMPRDRAPALWCIGGVSGGIGLLLLGLRGQIPDSVSYLIGQPLLALGALLVTQSLQIDRGRTLRWKWVTLAIVGYAAALWPLMATQQWSAIGILTRTFNLAVVLLLVAAAWQVGQSEDSRNARTIAAAYAVQGLAITANLVNALRGSNDIHTLPATALLVVTTLLTLMVALVAAMGYLGLALERSTRQRIALAQEISRAQQWRDRREELVQLDRERTLGVLADSLGHEIAQPLTAALLFVQTGQRQLATYPLDTLRQQRWLEQIVANIQRAGEIVARIRQFIRPMPMQHAPVDLVEVLRDLQRLLRQEAINRHVKLQFQLPSSAYTMGDALQLAHAVLQVLRNAMKAVADGPEREVDITMATTPVEIRVQIADSGPGLPQSILQLGEGRPESQPQSLQGIGLFVVQSILSRHHGRLELENARSGGAVVSMILPRHRAAHAPREEARPPRAPTTR